ncbi:MAG: RsmD family RNA methyltransferase [Candidatus Zixiibacteriota bacterium]
MVIKDDQQFQFQIIAGDLKGRIIRTPNLGTTRPPLTRLRKAIFDFLWPHISDQSYLDLFSGTGSYLFEAVSRGASRAVGVELDPRLAECINRQAKELRVSESLNCLTGDVFETIPRFSKRGERFDVVMIAPPQYKGLIDKTLQVMHASPVVASGGLIVCQHDTSELKSLQFPHFPIEQQRKYGNTTFTVLKVE